MRKTGLVKGQRRKEFLEEKQKKLASEALT